MQSIFKAEDIASILKGGTIAIANLLFPVGTVFEIKDYVDGLIQAKSTVSGGRSNGTIVADGYAARIYEYSEGDGKDVYYHFTDNKTGKNSSLSTLKIKKGRISDVKISGTVGIKREQSTVTAIQPIDFEPKYEIIGKVFPNVIYGYSGEDYLFGNNKNDTIYSGYKDTVYGGTDNDTIIHCGNVVEIYAEDGKDNIDNSGDKVTIETGKGNDKIVSIGDEVKIDGGDNNDTIEVHGFEVTVWGGFGNDSIRLGGVINNILHDDKSMGMTVDAGANNDIVKSDITYCTITGGIGDDLISLSAGADENFIKYNVGDGNDRIYGLTSDDTLKIMSGTVDNVTVSSSDVILTVGEGSLAFKKFSGKEFNVTKADESINTYKLSADKKTKEVTGSIVDGNGQKTLYGTGGDEHLYSSDIYGGAGNDKLYAEGKGDLIIYNWGDGDDTVSGSGRIRVLGASYSTLSTLGNLVLDVGEYLNQTSIQSPNGRITLIGGEKYFKIEGTCRGEFFPEGLSFEDEELKVSEDFTGTEINLMDFEDLKKIDASDASKRFKLVGDAKDNTLVGGKGKNTLFGDEGKDTLVGDEDNDTLTGGAGKDLLIYTSGKDVITDYDTGDKISVGAEVTKIKTSGSNVIFITDAGTLTVQNAKGKTLAVIDSTCKEYSTVVGGNALTLTDDSEISLTAGSSVKIIDASKRKTAVEITGNKLANTILGGSKNDTLYGRKSDDSLIGGKGNDLLWGDAGADTFIYHAGDGKDIIYGFDDNDTLTFDNLDFTPSYSKKNDTITFKFDSSSKVIN